MKQPHQQVLEKYSFLKDKPLASANNYTVWQGNQKETNIPVTIKMIKFPHIELPKYLKKLKDVKSDFVIKVFELSIEQSSILLVTEQVTFGTLKKALRTCEHLDQNDSVFIARVMLNGHVDMLREDCNWFGTQDDIEFTDTGMKLSWNNSCQYNLVNPFPNLLARLTTRTEAMKGSSLLPFPEIKAINELSKICKENASEISLHPQMKQKIKFSKRKGKNWMGLREVKGKNEYFDELSFFAISNEYGFIRVKVYDLGKISPNLLAFNKTKNTFTKVINVYDQGDKTYILSEYSNDGNLENYVKRLKASALSLKEDQIEFFFYSLFEPIKAVQESTLKSINMLHIKNIYIENGIPKIGEPIPLNERIFQILSDRSDVPDFYHTQFKKDPTSHDAYYDTYSLGVLLYKLMYTQYPIFPNNKVHIPTTPNYNKRLKMTLEIFLNEGGTLIDLEKKIEVSENVLKQVQENKDRLKEGFQPKKEKKVRKQEEQQSDQLSEKPETLSKISIIEEEQEKKSESVESNDDEDEDACCNIIARHLKLTPAEKLEKTYAFLETLQQSPYRKCRIWGKIIFILILYIFMFYYQFLVNDVALIADRSLLQRINVTIGTTNHQIITSNYNNFDSTFSKTGQSLSSLQGQGLWCAINSYAGGPNYSKTVSGDSNTWIVYIFSGLGCVVIMLALKVIQINVLDEIRAWSFRQNGKGKFNITNFAIFCLSWQTLLAGHFFLFNFIYYSQIDPCFGFRNGVYYGSTYYLLNDSSTFLSVYVAVYIAQLLMCIAHLIMIKLNESVPYNRLINPITIFGLALFIFILMIRLGAIMQSSYYPSAGNDPTSIISNIFRRGELIGILGVFPQLLLLIELAICLISDAIFYCLLDKNQSLLSNDASVANIDGLDDLV